MLLAFDPGLVVAVWNGRKEIQGMKSVHVAAQRLVSAPPEKAYCYISDHLHHHHRFLPEAFSDFQVEEGGIGAGTVVSYRLRAAGRSHLYRARVDEPEPGRVLTETLIDTGAVTSFTVLPQPEGSLVRIETFWPASKGVRGWIEGVMLPYILRPLYEDELALL